MRGHGGLTLILLTVGAAILLAPAAAAAQKSEWAIKFENLWGKAQEADDAGRWPEAVRYYTEVRSILPFEAMSCYRSAVCYAHLGRQDEAFASLNEAARFGWDDKEGIVAEEAFQSLHADPRFRKLLVRVDAVRNEPILVYVPDTVDRTKPAPLIVALHGRGENPHAHLPFWKDAADRLGAVVTAPRGVRKGHIELLNTWDKPDIESTRDTSDIDAEASKKVVDAAIALAGEKCNIDKRRIVLAGYSQGGAVALRLLVDDPHRYAGAFTMATLYKSPGVAAWRQAGETRKIRVRLLTGELDRLKRHSEKANRELTEAGVEVSLISMPSVGHEPPTDCVERQVRGVRLILKD